MADNVDEQLTKAGYSLKSMEGYPTGNWILMDYGDLVVHVFDRQNRLFYDLERIWRDGEQMTWMLFWKRSVINSNSFYITNRKGKTCKWFFPFIVNKR